jgi:CheY-like chemotaxis protein
LTDVHRQCHAEEPLGERSSEPGARGTHDAPAERSPLTALGELSGVLAAPADRAALREVLGQWIADTLAADTWGLLLGDEEASAPTGLASVVVDQNRPLRTADYAVECARHGLLAPGAAAPRHWLGAPVAVEGVPLGALALARHARPFTAEEQSVLAVAAGVVALALRGVDLAADGARTGHELSAAREEIARGRGLVALGEVAAGIVHDFHNTLAAILIRTEILEAESDDPELRRHIEVIHSAALGGARSVRRIRDLAQPRRPRPFRPVELNEVLADVVAVTRARWRDEAQARDVRYEVVVETQPVPAVTADVVEIGDALTLLVYQTLADAPDGGRIVLRTGVADDRVFCSITSGTSPTRARDADDSPARVTEIARRHGGDVMATRDVRGDRTVTLWLPALPRTRASKAAAGTGARQLKVLVIDDEPSVREALREALARLGHQVVACASGREGLDCLGAQAFDLVLSDLSMPDMSGWEVAREIKRGRPTLPVALVTGWGDEVDPEEASARGVDALLAKPLTTRALQAAVQALMRGSSTA